MTKNVFFLILLTVVHCYSVRSQRADYSDIIAPSPNAVALGEHAAIPVDNYTGVSSINIPLWTIQERDVNLPIALTYHASGVKVENIASNVGLNWALLSGGIITRSIRGELPDDYFASLPPLPCNNCAIHGKGMLSHNVRVEDASDATLLSEYRTKIAFENLDIEPDIFFFNFNGHKGEFVFDRDKKVILLSNTDLVITPTFENYVLIAFEVKVDDGTRYLFSEREITKITYRKDVSVSYLAYASSWLLKKIISPSGYEVNFTYSDEDVQYSTRLTRSRGKCGVPNTNCDGISSITSIRNEVNGKVISQISTQYTQIDFDLGTREDIAGNAKRVNNISIKAKRKDINGSSLISEVKLYSLSYQYVISPERVSGGNIVPPESKRLFLTEISSDEAGKPPYKFTYNALILPWRLSSEQDIYGYYNDNNASSLIPEIYVYPALSKSNRYRIYPISNYTGTSHMLPGANRRTNVNTLEAGMLTKIVYPTGGSTEFFYEPNLYYDAIAQENILGGGLRIKKKITYDGISHNSDLVEQYSYKLPSNENNSSGVLFDMPIFAFPVAKLYTYATDKNPLEGTPVIYSSSMTEFDKYDLLTMRFSHNTSSLGQTVGSHVGYSSVTIDKGKLGKEIFKYNSVLPFGSEEDYYTNHDRKVYYFYPTVSSINHYLYDEVSKAKQDGFVFDGPWTYPFAPSTNYDFWRGLLLEVLYLDYNGNTVKKEINSYEPVSKNNGPKTVTYIKIAGINRFSGYNFTYSRYSVTAETSVKLIKKIISVYDAPDYDPSKFVSTVMNFEYNGSNHYKPTGIIKKQSDNRSYKVTYKYPKDYITTFSTGSDEYLALKKLNEKNINSSPIETITSFKEANETTYKVIGSDFVSYKTSASIVYPYQYYTLATTIPIPTPSSAFTESHTNATGTTGKIFKDTRYLLKYQTLYDDQGRLVEEKENEGINRSYVYESDQPLPIATVVNSNNLRHLHTSFESQMYFGRNNNNFSIESDSYSGTKSLKGSSTFELIKWALPAGRYIVSYWTKGSTITNHIYGTYLQVLREYSDPDLIDGWKYYEKEINLTQESSSSDLRLKVDGYIDEIRIYPNNALMNTATYNLVNAVTSSTDENNRTTFYEYDEAERIRLIRNQERDIRKRYEYFYKGN